MNEAAKKQCEKRTQNIKDVFDNKIPKRVPISVSLPLTAVADYGGVDRKEAYWDPSLLEQAADELCDRIPTDTCIYAGSVYAPYSSQTLDAKNKLMSNTGIMQHPNTECMAPEEYDGLIADPYAFIVETCMPRLYKNLNAAESGAAPLYALYQESVLEYDYYAKTGAMVQKLNEKYGYPTDAGIEGFGGRAPMDFIGDQLRSFSGICTDIRRYRKKILEALDAIYPMMYKMGRCPDTAQINRYNPVMFQLHMATYIRKKDFQEVWMPSWKRQVTDYAALGMRCGAFLEHDWTRLLDDLYELPTGMYFKFELTDPKAIKEKLGQKFVLGGGFPLNNLLTCTKQEVIDKTKEWLDIMAPGGQYIFGFDKDPITLADIKIENLQAVCETVRDYGVYDNAGESTGDVFNQADYSHSQVEDFKSKYYMTWEDYLKKFPNTPESAKAQIMAAQDNVFEKFFYMSC
ncbi:MAG: uroporphyrinogen decarboxylase family protein [Eubacterium sp.]|nr:uroporphyrinogen decarboxylase family protein [Eubacterium sp.]